MLNLHLTFQLKYPLCMFQCKCEGAVKRRLYLSPVYILKKIQDKIYIIDIYLTEEPKICLEEVFLSVFRTKKMLSIFFKNYEDLSMNS